MQFGGRPSGGRLAREVQSYVDFANNPSAFALSTAVCANTDRQSGGGRRLCRNPAGKFGRHAFGLRDRLAATGEPLPSLFARLEFCQIDGGGEQDGQGSLAAAERRINSISSLPRQAFLLVAVEGFTAAEAARILEVSEKDVESLLDIAGQEIAHQVATNILDHRG